MSKTATNRPAWSYFTLIELLVVVAIIAILAAMLLPVLSSARARARRIACMNNFKQCNIALTMYADDCVRFPKISWNGDQPDVYKHGNDRLLSTMPNYLGSLELWQCPNLSAAPLDDPNNTRNRPRCNYNYYPGKDGFGSFYTDFHPNQNSENDVLMSDEAYLWNGGSRFRINHDSGEYFVRWPATNPSLHFYKSTRLVGSNTSFCDGHVEWISGDQLKLIGTANDNEYYSVDRN